MQLQVLGTMGYAHGINGWEQINIGGLLCLDSYLDGDDVRRRAHCTFASAPPSALRARRRDDELERRVGAEARGCGVRWPARASGL